MIKFFINNALYPMMHILKGNRVREIKKELIKHQCSDDLMNIQRDRLEKLLIHCINNVKFYKNIGITEQEIKDNPYEVLEKKIKPMNKIEFRDIRDDLLAENISEEKRMKNMTGGTSGIPTYFYMTREQVETYEAARFRGLSWYGIDEGSKSIMIWANPFDLSKNELKKYQLKDKYLKNRQILSLHNVSSEEMCEYVELINKEKPEFIYGYAVMIATYAKVIEENGYEIKCPLKAVVTTSEMIYEEDKIIIERVFKCKVVSEYGAKDAGILAYSCKEGNLHITAENCIIEVLHPITLEKLPDGESGVFAITDLNNFVEPRLRYLIGDTGSLSDTGCSCGLKLPVMKELGGRDDSVLIKKDGTFIQANACLGINILRTATGIKEYQVIIHNEDEATIQIISETGEEIDTDEMVAKIEEKLDLKITVKYVDNIPVSPSGKRRSIVKEY